MVNSRAEGAPERNTERLRANVRFGSEAEVQQTRAGCLLLAISGHSQVRRVLLGVLGSMSCCILAVLVDQELGRAGLVPASAVRRIADQL